MMQGTAFDAYVACFAFATSFLLSGKRPVLAFSTRVLLVALLGCAFTYTQAERTAWHDALGVATIILNLAFIAFGAVDYHRWLERRR